MEKGLSDVNLLKGASAERHSNFVSRRLICKDFFIFPESMEFFCLSRVLPQLANVSMKMRNKIIVHRQRGISTIINYQLENFFIFKPLSPTI